VFILAAVTAWVYGPGPLMEISMYLEKAELGDLYCRLVCLFMRGHVFYLVSTNDL
jgi:hypothetical protein